MGKKKIQSVEDSIKFFEEAMHRASLRSYYHVNKIMLSINDKGNKLLIIPDQTLWDNLILKEDFSVKELDINQPEEYDLQQWISYGEDLETSWINIDVTEELFSGKIFRIQLKGYEYQLPINRELMPLKLKKNEYCDISYKIFNKPLLILAIKKRFEMPVQDTGFTIIRLFQVI